MPQDRNSAASWSQNIQHDPLSAAAEDEDFTKFLDLDTGFEQFQHIDSGHGQSSLETPMGRLAFGHHAVQDLALPNLEMMQNIDMSTNHLDGPHMFSHRSGTNTGGHQQYQPFHAYQQMGHSHHYHVPPTPVSAEMHAAKYHGQMDSAGQMIFDRHQDSFTPLVSPAQTPLDNAYNMPDYVMADDFFSPLTSPAIEAQPNFASTNATASPIDLNTDHSSSNTPVSTVRKRGSKRNLPQPRQARSMKQSPAMKPQPKRRQVPLNMSHDRLETMLETPAREEGGQPDIKHSNLFGSSEDSVSPEPLSEVLMRPPPIPSSATRSPATLLPQTSDQNLPATPSMIMRMPNKQSSSTDSHGIRAGPDIMEDIALPAAATTLISRQIPGIDTQVFDVDDQTTPTLSAKTPKLSAESTPRTSVIRTQNASNESLDKMKKPEAKVGGRGGKKRQSVSSSAISPALRPKISPSISPLAPASGPGLNKMSAETSALYLASKSNYQNILDGTHLPGVSYPETLAENLSSKRTSHKIAEQGRRNRINLALKEIESLLPPSIALGAKKEKTSLTSKESEDGSPDKPGSSGQGTSKASTVEMAITYIKSLQLELKETKEKLEAAEKQLAKENSGVEGHSE